MSDIAHYLVVGSGSVARRHIENIKILFPKSNIGCISASGKLIKSTDVGADVIYVSLEEAMKQALKFAVVATPAPFHVQQAAELVKNNIPVLIEKPLSDSLATFKKVEDVLYANQDKIEVGYNLRYMSSAIYLKKFIEQEELGKIHSVLINVGQYLPDWRPQADYRQNVSARKDLGGGVLLELSHELDYLTWLFGKFETVFCVAKNSGSLDIDVEDMANAILTRPDGPLINIHMDFLQHKASRTCMIIAELGTLNWDLMTNSISLHYKTGEEVELFVDQSFDRGKTFQEQLSRFAKVAEGELLPSINLQQGLDVLNLVDAMRQSALTQQIVTIGNFNQ